MKIYNVYCNGIRIGSNLVIHTICLESAEFNGFTIDDNGFTYAFTNPAGFINIPSELDIELYRDEGCRRHRHPCKLTGIALSTRNGRRCIEGTLVGDLWRDYD